MNRVWSALFLIALLSGDASAQSATKVPAPVPVQVPPAVVPTPVPVAPPPPAKPGEIKCQSGTPQGELACLTPDLKELDDAVERQLYQLGRKMRENQRIKHSRAYSDLRASQVSWRQYRGQFCSIESLAGEPNPDWLKVRYTECLMRLTKDRLESLRDIEATLE
jgi:uncharacterized protein YecT (DUF1311 family)